MADIARSQAQVLNEFKKNLISFMDELIDQFPEEGDLVILRVFLNDQIPIKKVMDIFIHNINKDSNNLRNMVKDQNEAFFLENNVFQMTQAKTDRLNHFKSLWRSGCLDEEDKRVVWTWVDTFVFLADKYTKTFTDR
jgi:hypothetical protein